MTEAELGAIGERHVPTPSSFVCDECGQPWPCEQFRLLSEVERLRGKLRIAEARIAGAKALLAALEEGE